MPKNIEEHFAEKGIGNKTLAHANPSPTSSFPARNDLALE